MKKILIPLLVLVMLCVSLTALAEGEAVTLELNTAKLAVYNPGDPALEGLTSEESLPVIVVHTKKSVTLQVNVTPRTVRNKKVTLTVDNEEAVQVKGNGLSGKKPGEAVLTIASQEDPSVTLQYRIVVIQPVTRLAVSASAKNVPVGGTIQLTPAFTPENVTRKQVTWASADERIATVDENGVLTGVKRGKARVTVMAADGSNVRANINIDVTQSAEEITLTPAELTIDVGRNGVLRATVLPKDANNKKVVWSSSDESIAKVNAQGRVTAVSLGDCEITCTSEEVGTVQAKAIVHIQQPVKKIILDEAPIVYNGESGKLTWTIEPENATNPALKFSTYNPNILTVSDDGTFTGVTGGETYITAVSTDGSNRQARIRVRINQHLTGARMRRKVAYIDVGETANAGAVLEPEKSKYINHNMIWSSADPGIASAAQGRKSPSSVDITGVSVGDTEITGVTEDGGFPVSMKVKIGYWDSSLKITDAGVRGADAYLTVKNVSELTITGITAEVTVYDADGKKVPCNKKDPKKPFRMVYRKTLAPGASTKEKDWKTVDFMLPESLTVSKYVIKVTQFEIDHDWIKVIRPKNQPTKKCPVHI